jgi:hypothetical protein
MSPEEQRVGEAAVAVGHVDWYEQIYEEVARKMGISADEAKAIIERLSNDCLLLKRGGPAQNLAEAGKAGDVKAKAWYERGKLWRSAEQA